MIRAVAVLTTVASCMLAALALAAEPAPPLPPAGVEQNLYRPEGPGPFPAVVLLHGCSGIIGTERGWARELRGRGYVALIVDSFGPRGHREICTDFRRVTRGQRVEDAFAALRWLEAQPFVIPDAVALMGSSNGGYALLAAMRSPLAAAPRGFRAAVAMYPECRFDVGASFQAPILVLMGEADDWTLASHCRDLASVAARGAGAPVLVHAYPGVHHSFDNQAIAHFYYAEARNPNKPGGCCGATVAYDARAHADALERVAGFLGTHLGAAPNR